MPDAIYLLLKERCRLNSFAQKKLDAPAIFPVCKMLIVTTNACRFNRKILS